MLISSTQLAVNFYIFSTNSPITTNLVLVSGELNTQIPNGQPTPYLLDVKLNSVYTFSGLVIGEPFTWGEGVQNWELSGLEVVSYVESSYVGYYDSLTIKVIASNPVLNLIYAYGK